MAMLKCLKEERGFTLIETFIAAVLLAVAFMSLAFLTTRLIRHNIANERTVTAMTLGESRMEKLRELPYAKLLGGTNTVALDNISYTLTWTVTPLAADISDVVVTITWTDFTGSRSASLGTRRTKYY